MPSSSSKTFSDSWKRGEDIAFAFFFSSRRRHTRYWRDWSSDVCSSDLPRLPRARPPGPQPRWPDEASHRTPSSRRCHFPGSSGGLQVQKVDVPCRRLVLNAESSFQSRSRSEERRVGKECRSQGSTQCTK